MKTAFTITVILLSICCTCWAIPPKINYQGYLTRQDGSPLDTTVTMMFKLYTDSLGQLMWMENHTDVQVVDGLFNVRIGESVSLTDDLLDRPQVWLGLTIGGDTEMAPRARLVSVGYSYRVGTVDGATGGTIDGKLNVGPGNTNPGNFANAFGQDNAANADHSTVSGGRYNAARGVYSTVGGGGGDALPDSNSASGEYTTIGGGHGNLASGGSATVGGGAFNRATGNAATVGGGYTVHATETGATASGGSNVFARGFYSTVGGGGGFFPADSNSALGTSSTIGGGKRNIADMYSVVGGGSSNWAVGQTATIAGGSNNKARGSYSFIGGGGGFLESDSNSAAGQYGTIGGGVGNFVDVNSTGSVIGGGHFNRTTGNAQWISIAGGFDNTASAQCAAIDGGNANFATDSFATVAGGRHNRSDGRYSTVAGGGGPGPNDGNFARADYSAIGGGDVNDADANSRAATISGGMGNKTYNQYAVIGGGSGNRARGLLSTVGGGGGIANVDSNSAAGEYTTVGGGHGNYALGGSATVAGGAYNQATGNASFVGGGYDVRATGVAATATGGSHVYARGDFSTISGGGGWNTTDSNSAAGAYATVPGGRGNRANGDYSFAAGYGARALAPGSFLWADANDVIQSNIANSFAARATGGVWFFTNTGLSSGLTLPAGGSAWTTISDSTRKRNIRLVDTKEMLDRVSRMPVKQWSYKSQDPSIEHIGPIAQDFWNEFHVGDDSLTISTIDPSGISLAAIQELAKRLQNIEAENAALRARVQSLEANTQATLNRK